MSKNGNKWRACSKTGAAHIWAVCPETPLYARSLCGLCFEQKNNLQTPDKGQCRCTRCKKAGAMMLIKNDVIRRVSTGESRVAVALSTGINLSEISHWTVSAGLKRSRKVQPEYLSLLDYHLARREEYKIFTNDGRSWLMVPDNDTMGGHLTLVMEAACVPGWQVTKLTSQNINLIPTYAYDHILVSCLVGKTAASIRSKILGSITTPKKANASRINGKKGGRPRGKPQEMVPRKNNPRDS